MNQATELNFEYMCLKMDVDNVDNHLTKLNLEYMCAKTDVDNVDNHLTKLKFRIYVCENGRR